MCNAAIRLDRGARLAGHDVLQDLVDVGLVQAFARVCRRAGRVSGEQVSHHSGVLLVGGD
jgi:hypothetical protein